MYMESYLWIVFAFPSPNWDNFQGASVNWYRHWSDQMSCTTAAIFRAEGHAPSTRCHGDTRPGKHTKNYGKSPFLMGKLTISMAIFNSYVKLPEGILWRSPKQMRKSVFSPVVWWCVHHNFQVSHFFCLFGVVLCVCACVYIYIYWSWSQLEFQHNDAKWIPTRAKETVQKTAKK